MGLNHVVDVLRGSENAKVVLRAHNTLSTHGVGRDKPVEFWQTLGRQLIGSGYLKQSDDGYGTLELTDSAGDALRKRSEIRLPRITVQSRGLSRPKKQSGGVECDEGLFEALRGVRKALADKREVPPYVIFGDVSLRQMARRYPRTEGELIRIPGVGQSKLKKFGAEFIQVIDEWLLENESREFEYNSFIDPLPQTK